MDNNNSYEYHIVRPENGVHVTGAPAAGAEKKRRRALPAIISLFLIFTLLVGGAGGVVGYYISQNNLPVNDPVSDVVGTPDRPETPSGNTQKEVPLIAPTASTGSALTIQEIFALGDKSTVAISTTTETTNVFGQQVSQAAAGSGFILTADGYILTNHHVIEGASNVTVLMHDGTEYPAEIIGSDSVTDIAVLKISASGLSPVSIGDSDKMAVGDQVVAIGNPLGELANSLTVGYISAKKRIVSIDDVPRVMQQTDASVSPGNSGGPLFNIYGEVIGVVSAKTVADGVEGIGFAIPINIAADIANTLIRDGAIKGRPLLGIEYQDVSAMADKKDYPKGAYVVSVTSGSAADKAGIKTGDVIIGFNGTVITAGDELRILKNLCRVGDTVPLTVWRNGKEVTLSVTFDTEMPEETSVQEEVQQYYNPWRR